MPTKNTNKTPKNFTTNKNIAVNKSLTNFKGSEKPSQIILKTLAET